MFRDPWELDVHVRHRMRALEADLASSLSRSRWPAKSRPALARMRRGIGLGLIVVGERLAGRDAIVAVRASAGRAAPSTGRAGL